MYKLLVFVHKSDDKSSETAFNEKILPLLSAIAGKEIHAAKVESSLLLEQKYSSYCELVTDSKEIMDELMSTKPGKEFTKMLSDYHRQITFINVDFGDSD